MLVNFKKYWIFTSRFPQQNYSTNKSLITSTLICTINLSLLIIFRDNKTYLYYY